MKRRGTGYAKLSSQFYEAHEIGARKFGWNWMIANKQAVRACVEVGLNPADEQIRTLLSLAALHILTNTLPTERDGSEGCVPDAG